MFYTKIIHDNTINLNNCRYVRVFCCVVSSSVRSWKRSQSLFTLWGDFRLFYFISGPSCVLESVSLGLLVVIRQPAGPAGLCSCQSPQEWCLKRETTGSEIAVYSLSSQMKNTQHEQGHYFWLSQLQSYEQRVQILYNWRYYLLTFVNLLKNTENFNASLKSCYETDNMVVELRKI